jgi:hypothetical protein
VELRHPPRGRTIPAAVKVAVARVAVARVAAVRVVVVAAAGVPGEAAETPAAVVAGAAVEAQEAVVAVAILEAAVVEEVPAAVAVATPVVVAAAAAVEVQAAVVAAAILEAEVEAGEARAVAAVGRAVEARVEGKGAAVTGSSPEPARAFSRSPALPFQLLRPEPVLLPFGRSDVYIVGIASISSGFQPRRCPWAHRVVEKPGSESNSLHSMVASIRISGPPSRPCSGKSPTSFMEIVQNPA